MASPLAERLRRHVTRARLFPKAGTAIVAVSGGADSVALLDLLHDLAPQLGLTLVVAHADHGIQSDSRTVGQSVSALAARYGLPFELAELVAHVAARGLAHHDDPANRDPRHLRSWVRHALLPLLLERLGPRAVGDVLRLGSHAAADRRAWDAALELLPELALHVEHGGFSVAREPLRRYDATVAVALVRAAARRAGLVVGPVRARRLLSLAKGRSGRRLPLGAEWVAEAAFDRLRVIRGDPAAPDPVAVSAERGDTRFGLFSVEWRPDPAPARVERGGW